jgi:uncharacterized membrane protein
MEMLFKVLLMLHIIGGGVGLLSGTINIIRKKGDKKHKLTGKFFLYGMLLSGLSALVLSVMHPNYFLFIVGVFTLYMVGTGERYLFLRQLQNGQSPILLDWLLAGSMLIFGIAFMAFGIKIYLQQEKFGLVFIVFGFISLRFVYTDWQNYTGKIKDKNYWLLAHLQRMTGAYIASLTAFLVVNKILPGIIVWLLPTLLLTPLIFSWSKKYQTSK